MFSFLIYGYLIYRIIKWLVGGDSASSSSDYGNKRLNDKSFANIMLAPLAAVVRMGRTETARDANRILNFIRNTYIRTVFIDRMVMSAQNTFTNYMRISVGELTKHANKAVADIRSYGVSSDVKKTLLFAMFDVCERAGGMNEQQRNFIKKFCINIRVSAKVMYEEYMRYDGENSYDSGYSNGGSYQGYQGGYNSGYSEQKADEIELEKAYKTLGLDKSATDDEIKAKKNKLLRKWHPDLYSTQGEEAIKKATQNSQRINEAYDIIKEARGIS